MKLLVARLLACLMLVGSLVPQNDLSELSKLPQLLEHYRFHHSVAGGGLSLVEFLAEHYGSGTKQHFGCTFESRHQHDHQGLPLHGRHAGEGGVFLVTGAGLVVRRPVGVALARCYWVAGSPRCLAGRGTGLLQPPRA